MNTEQTAQQLELAAKILRTGHPWECKFSANVFEKPVVSLITAISSEKEIRPVLATPPDNRPIHNPDNLTAEQVGVGYRLLCAEDGVPSGKVDTWMFGGWCSAYVVDKEHLYECDKTYRLPLSVPWPEAKPDPYAELKKAHAEGKVIQGCIRGHWIDCTHPTWKYPVNTYREKPEVPDVCVVPQIIKNTPFELPPPPPGMQWHRTDRWKECDLPSGYRPLVFEESQEEGDEFLSFLSGRAWKTINPRGAGDRSNEDCRPRRTRRPLTFTHAGKTWTWHRPGDPMPCDGGRKAYIMYQDQQTAFIATAATAGWARNENGPSDIIGWRYADEKKTVPLGPEDVKPFTVIRRKGEAQTWHWRTVSYVDAVKVTCGNRGYEWGELAAHYERNESLPLTGKWNPDAWEPCSKQTDA